MTPLMGNRTPVIERDYVTLYTEVNHEGYTFLHCDVYKWGLDYYIKMMDDFTQWLATVDLKDNMLFYCIEPENEKTQKFAQLFGFNHYIEWNGYLIYMMEVE